MKIKRLYFNKLWMEKSASHVSILLGARQVGKSTLMRQLQQKAKREGLRTSYYDLEQPADLQKFVGTPEDIIKKIFSRSQVVFIDEFHYLKNASKIFKAVFDSRRAIKIYASGSSSLEIHKHLKESLAGRFLKTIIYPLTIEECRKVSKFQDNNYLLWGGMPGLIHCLSSNDRARLLENIVSTYITKDIKGLIKEENVRAFNHLLYLLGQSQGSVVINSNLARETGLSERTIVRHFEIMSQTYILHVVFSYSQNLANELKKSKKYYLMDLGIRNMLMKDFSSLNQRQDKGALYETAVLLLLQAQLKPNMELRFWRTKKGDEVDFILLKNRVPVPIEVKSNLSKLDVPDGLIKFLRRYPKVPFGIVFNATQQGKVLIEGREVFFKLWTEASNLEYLKDVI